MRPLRSIIQLFFIVILFLNSCRERCVKGSGDMVRIERDVSSFHKIKLNGNFNLYIQQGPAQKVELLADNNILPLIKTEVAGEVLEVGFHNHVCVRKSHRLDVFITVPSVSSISLNGSGNVFGEGKFTGGDAELTIIGSGEMFFSFEGNNIRSKIDGSGEINLSGRVDYASCLINGSGEIKSPGLHASNADAKISGSGKIEFSVADHLNLNISGSGDVIYYGNPSTQIAISGSGKVIKR